MPRSATGRIDQAAVGGDASGVTTAVGATATFTSPTISSGGALYLVVIFDVTAIGTASLTPSIVGVDPTSGKTWTVLPGAAVVTNVTTILRVGPNLPAAALTAVDIVPVLFRLVVTAGNANAASYSLSYQAAP